MYINIETYLHHWEWALPQPEYPPDPEKWIQPPHRAMVYGGDLTPMGWIMTGFAWMIVVMTSVVPFMTKGIINIKHKYVIQQSTKQH